MARRPAIGREMAGMGQAERCQRDLLLVTGEAILLARMPKERGDGFFAGLGQRQQRPLNGLGRGFGADEGGCLRRGLCRRGGGGQVFGAHFEQDLSGFVNRSAAKLLASVPRIYTADS